MTSFTLRRKAPLCVASALALLLLTSGDTPVRNAGAGEAARGELVAEANGELQLNTSPCGEHRTLVVFKSPYAKDSAGSITCHGSSIALVQVVQR